MPPLLGRPPPGPIAPGAVPAEEIVDRSEVVRQVVLGQHVDEHGTGHAIGQGFGASDLWWRPPLDEVVGKPLFGHAQMAVDQALGGRLEFGKHGRVIHIRPSSVGSRPPDLHVSVLPDAVGTRQSLAQDIAAVRHHYLDPVLIRQNPGMVGAAPALGLERGIVQTVLVILLLGVVGALMWGRETHLRTE